MADRFWIGATDSDWNDTGNWSTSSGGGGGASVPTSSDATIFDSSGNVACTCDVAIDIASMVVGSGYTVKLDFGDSAFAHACAGDMTFDGGNEVDCGDSTITCSGDFDNLNQTTWTKGTSTLVMDGASKTLALQASGQKLYNFTVDGTIANTGSASFAGVSNVLLVNNTKTLTLSATNFFCSGTITIDGILTVNISQTFFCTTTTVDIVVSATGSLTGLGKMILGETASSSLINNGGTWDIAETQIEKAFEIKAGTYDGVWEFKQSAGTNFTVTFSGDTVFTGDVTFTSISANTYTLDFVTNNVDIEFQGDVTLSEPAATIVWSKAASITAVTFNGTTTYTDGTAAIQNIGDVICSGTSLTLATDMDCDDFSLDAGAFDINGKTLDVAVSMDWASGTSITDPDGGTFIVGVNFTADGQDISDPTVTWFLQVTGTAVASGTGDVKNCDANGGSNTEINATSGPWNDSGGNTNWLFSITSGCNFILAPRLSSPTIPDNVCWELGPFT